VPPLKKARAIHHKQAQLLAAGHSNEEVASIIGTTSARISLLRNDPTFRELIAFYSDQSAEIELETHKRIQNTLIDVLELSANEIQQRLEDDTQRARMPLGELRRTAEFAADRSIAPPRATQQGSTMPPARIEFNFGFKSKQDETKTIDIEQQEQVDE
jgi:hypothetical protein